MFASISMLAEPARRGVESDSLPREVPPIHEGKKKYFLANELWLC